MHRNKKLKKWLKQFEDDMASAVFAEAGEFETARQIMKKDRKILLAVTDEKRDVNAFKYALNMCKRIGAALEILFSFGPDREDFESFISELKNEGIEHTLVEVKRCLKEEILNYTEKRRDILFVVVESSDGLDINCEDDRKKISTLWQHLKCPLVVVSDLASA
jgi:hypothetical protein